MTQPSDAAFLDVPTLLDASRPGQQLPWRGIVIGLFMIMMIFLWRFCGETSQCRQAAAVLSTLAFVSLLGGLSFSGAAAARALRAEQNHLELIEQQIQLRRWQEAGLLVQNFLSRPARSVGARAQALLFLAMILARYHRFDDAVNVYDSLLDEVPLDDAAVHAVRLGRAMALLRDDSLLDADRAIAELRRSSRGFDSAGLTLVELYRDVKTGHPADAIATFEKSLPSIRKQLGIRSADTWALAARAYDLLNQPVQAQFAYDNATLLTPVTELHRRYPEIGPLIGKYVAAPTPAEVA